MIMIIIVTTTIRPSERSGSWTLVVENSQAEDSGSYRCQVRLFIIIIMIMMDLAKMWDRVYGVQYNV